MRSRLTNGCCFLGLCCLLALGGLLAERSAHGDASLNASDSARPAAISGAELFRREWLPDDPRSHGGDGLGPVFNDSSCVACHNQGGPGGGGPAEKNVDIVSAFLNDESLLRRPAPSAIGSLVRLTFGIPQEHGRRRSPEQLERHRESLIHEASLLHPGFVTARSVVVHLHGTTEGYDQWRTNLIGFNVATSMRPDMLRSTGTAIVTAEEPLAIPEEEVLPAVTEHAERAAGDEAADHGHHAHGHSEHAMVLSPSPQAVSVMETHRVHSLRGQSLGLTIVRGNFTLVTSQRNPTALFGVGLIDSIPDEVLLEAAKRRDPQFPGVTGRVARLPGDRIGRFGWKAQKASLRDFAMTACAVELGLHVPEHVQSGLPTDPDYKPTGYDMNKAECDALVTYLQKLPAPDRSETGAGAHTEYLETGRALFARVGCAACHSENLGEATGIYSDLLLHDMGEDLGDTGDYGVFVPETPGGDAEGVVPPLAAAGSADAPQSDDAILGATRLEWRTPPLWGVRDSAPYMHDGRARNLEQAIAFHGGEGRPSALQYFSLSAADRQKVQAFLKSLVAPRTVAQR